MSSKNATSVIEAQVLTSSISLTYGCQTPLASPIDVSLEYFDLGYVMQLYSCNSTHG